MTHLHERVSCRWSRHALCGLYLLFSILQHNCMLLIIHQSLAHRLDKAASRKQVALHTERSAEAHDMHDMAKPCMRGSGS